MKLRDCTCPIVDQFTLLHSSRRRGLSVAALIVITVAACLGAAQAGEMRTWSSATGNHKTEAEFVRLKEDDTVVLKRRDGRTVEVPLKKLSLLDQAYVQLHAKRGEQPAGAAGVTQTPDQVEQDAQQCHSAKEAVLVYTFYLAKPGLTPEQRSKAKAGLEAWKKKAEQGLVRVGEKWMTKKEASELRKRADAKVEHAMELLRLGNGELSRKTLEDASRLDPDSIQADFLMGIVYGLIDDNDKKSQYHFERCLQRDPGNVSVLNNLAISLLFQKKYAPAVQCWKTAAAAAPKMSVLSQNVGSLIALAGSRELRLADATLDDLSEIYEQLTADESGTRPTQVYFLYSPPYGDDWENSSGKASPGGKKESVIVSSGSGFVVHPNVILTNRHVVEGASGLLVVDPKTPKADPLAAELIAISDSLDLALIRCEKLDAPAVRLTDKLPARGSDIMVLGYPLGPSFGTTLKSTRGAMVSLPDSMLDNMCLYDAITNPGNSGGPLCDKAGRVAGVVRAVTGHIGGSYGAAIPMSHALPFVRKHVPELGPVAADGTELDWPAVDAVVAPSTVLIMCKEDLCTNTGIGDGRR